MNTRQGRTVRRLTEADGEAMIRALAKLAVLERTEGHPVVAELVGPMRVSARRTGKRWRREVAVRLLEGDALLGQHVLRAVCENT